MQVKKISAAKTYAIRKEILRKGIDLPFYFDEDLALETFHLGAFKEDKIVGVATFMNKTNKLLNGSQYQLRGMATLREVRGLGFGKALLEKAIVLLKEKQTDKLWCNAREIALPFYQKKGFKIIGKPFEINKIGTHYTLVKELMQYELSTF